MRPEKDNSGVVSDVAKKAFARKREGKKPAPSQKGSRFDLEKAETVDSGTGATTWAVFDCADFLPVEARFAVLEAYGRCIDAPTGAREWQARREEGAIVRSLVHVRGTTTSDITSMVSEGTVELSSQRTFEWQSSAMTERLVRLVGYVI